jgi:hypothetical protein
MVEVYFGNAGTSSLWMSDTTTNFLYDATVMAFRAIAGAVIACRTEHI